jgi:hypothetical protein
MFLYVIESSSIGMESGMLCDPIGQDSEHPRLASYGKLSRKTSDRGASAMPARLFVAFPSRSRLALRCSSASISTLDGVLMPQIQTTEGTVPV